MNYIETAKAAIDNYHRKGFTTENPGEHELLWIQTLAAVAQADETAKLRRTLSEIDRTRTHTAFLFNEGFGYSPLDRTTLRQRIPAFNFTMRLDYREWQSIKSAMKDAILEAWEAIRKSDET